MLFSRDVTLVSLSVSGKMIVIGTVQCLALLKAQRTITRFVILGRTDQKKAKK
jgi:hypothetical protein